MLGIALALKAQQPVTQDTTVVREAPKSADTVNKSTESASPAIGKEPEVKRQRRDQRPWSQRIGFAFNTSFWANTSQVFAEINPLIYYRFPKILSIGTGPTYIFNYDRNSDKTLNGWGGKIVVRAQLLKFFYLWTEYQGIDNQFLVKNDLPDTGYHKEWEYVDSWFLGAGVSIRTGGRSGFSMSVLYDVLHSSSSPYYSPVIYRVGFGF
jgi:hypothetical protein